MEKDAADTFIPEFYAGRNIFITGATGFLGKALTEKLLRSCPDIGKIYLLMRPKVGLCIADRLKKMLDNKLFDKLRTERPSCFNKLIPIIGDTTIEDLGLLATDKQILIEKVSVIFHVAASVRFDEPLKNAVFSNTRSTRDICLLAQNMKNLVVLLHVSSTYTQTDKYIVDEVLYPADVDWKETIKIAESVDDLTLRTLTAKYLGTMSNTYTFTKKLAEQVINDYSKSLPCVIIRPSIVISSVDDPVKGWLDNFNGPVGTLVGGAKGILRVLYVDPVINCDFIPVDFAIKAMINTAWKRGIQTIDADNTVHVYNSSSLNVGRIDMQDLTDMGYKIAEDIPLEGIIWSPCTILTKSYSIYYTLVLLLHILPALSIDGIMKLTGARPILLRLQRKVYVTNNSLSYFLFNEWTFRNEKLLSLFDNLNDQNKNDFGFVYKNFDIPAFFTNGIIGAKIYLLNEDMNKLEAAKSHYKRMYWLNKIVMASFAIIVIWLLHLNNIFFYIGNFFSSLIDGSIFDES